MDLSKETPTALLKMGNDTKEEHDRLKQEIVELTYEVDELEKKINQKLEQLSTVEKKYVAIVEEINNR